MSNHYVSEIPLPSDFLLDNHASLQRRNDFEDMCDSLDGLFDDVVAETWEKAFQAGYDLRFSQEAKNTN